MHFYICLGLILLSNILSLAIGYALGGNSTFRFIRALLSMNNIDPRTLKYPKPQEKKYD